MTRSEQTIATAAAGRANTVIGRIPILDVSPSVAAGRLPAKAAEAESIPVGATVFREGHDAVAAGVVLTDPDGQDRPLVLMHPAGLGTDRWQARVRPDSPGDWTFRVEAWSDVYATWRHDAQIKVEAGIDVELMLAEGAQLLRRALARTDQTGERGRILTTAITGLTDRNRPVPVRLAAGCDDGLVAELTREPIRELVTASDPLPLRVDRRLALTGAWYEFFPRSIGAYRDDDGRWHSGTLATATGHLDYVAELGFDVVYLPPVHPIGRVNRKGANNTLDPGPNDPGSPWAIGAAEGGHDSVHPDLGTMADFDAFVARARELGLEVALDLALQAAPDHPWVASHPEWFTTRVDGTIAYAENPPKKYQDIYPVNFDNDPAGIYAEVLRIVELWIDHGVTLFRVDNPHTKPVAFWEWLLAQVHARHPEVIFLAEAFTRPAMMRTLGKIGFHQGYTYFTWRNEKGELEQYLAEVAQVTSDYFRPNFFPTTPDILTAYLQYGGPPAFKIRATLAATAAPSYGIYSGFELCEHVALRPGSEEFLDSEKYQYRPRELDAGTGLAPYLAKLNQIRRAHPALQQLRDLTVHGCDNDGILCFSKRDLPDPGSDQPGDTVIVVLGLDPHSVREGRIWLDMPALGLDWQDGFIVHELLTDTTWQWGQNNYVRLDPGSEPAHICVLRHQA